MTELNPKDDVRVRDLLQRFDLLRDLHVGIGLNWRCKGCVTGQKHVFHAYVAIDLQSQDKVIPVFFSYYKIKDGNLKPGYTGRIAVFQIPSSTSRSGVTDEERWGGSVWMGPANGFGRHTNLCDIMMDNKNMSYRLHGHNRLAWTTTSQALHEADEMTLMRWVTMHKPAIQWRMEFACLILESVISTNGGPWLSFKLQSAHSMSGSPFIVIDDGSQRLRPRVYVGKEFGAVDCASSISNTFNRLQYERMLAVVAASVLEVIYATPFEECPSVPRGHLSTNELKKAAQIWAYNPKVANAIGIPCRDAILRILSGPFNGVRFENFVIQDSAEFCKDWLDAVVSPFRRRTYSDEVDYDYHDDDDEELYPQDCDDDWSNTVLRMLPLPRRRRTMDTQSPV